MTSSRAKAIFEGSQILLTNLYNNWLDKRWYITNNTEDYVSPIKRRIEELGGIFVKMHFRPFGPEFIVDNSTYQISVTRGLYQIRKNS